MPHPLLSMLDAVAEFERSIILERHYRFRHFLDTPQTKKAYDFS